MHLSHLHCDGSNVLPNSREVIVMRISKSLLTAILLGAAAVSLPTMSTAQTVNGHRPSDHTADFTNHGYETYAGPNGPIVISPRDRELQRLDDQKRLTTDAYISNALPLSAAPQTRFR